MPGTPKRGGVDKIDLQVLVTPLLHHRPDHLAEPLVYFGVAAVVEAYADEAAFHGARLHSEIAEDVTGCWDAHMLEQILSNLVSNAIKYGRGTPVTVRLSLRNGRACFEVIDRGPGIDEAHRSRVFEKFERVVSTAGEAAGFGLGLWIVGRMVAAHAGTIGVDSAPGGGALFRVCLPLQSPLPQDKDQIA
jgi:signal transduction histidine kinase